ncbi:MAG: sulfate reduction electron transfer complex DsrMKJOP subunit DsrM [Desulfosarcinaceae bacterium]|jgi:nitrate reductase gamma subunit
MNVKYIYSFLAVLVLFLLAYVGVAGLGLEWLFGIIVPYLAVLVFVVFGIKRVMGWGRSAVPFRIPTTAGQQKSLDWIPDSPIDNPTTKLGVWIRMALEVLTFRSLFRNTRMKLGAGPKISYNLEIFLWLGSLAFHYAFFVTLVRHLRLFTEPVPFFVRLIETVDSFFRIEILYDPIQVALPGVFISGIVLLVAVTYLLLRRLFISQVRYISLASDFFPLFLILGIAFTGILMRYFLKINVVAAKELAMGLVTFHPTIPEGLGALFYVHLFFVSVLLAYFPFSKLMHLGGIFLSPTRNLTTNTRAVRHVNPWNYPVKIHTYEAYEDDFREKMVEAGLPVEKMPAATAAEEKE